MELSISDINSTGLVQGAGTTSTEGGDLNLNASGPVANQDYILPSSGDSSGTTAVDLSTLDPGLQSVVTDINKIFPGKTLEEVFKMSLEDKTRAIAAYVNSQLVTSAPSLTVSNNVSSLTSENKVMGGNLTLMTQSLKDGVSTAAVRSDNEILASWNASGQNLAAFSNTLQERANDAANSVLANGGTAEESASARITSLRAGLVELGMLPTLDSETFGKMGSKNLLETEMGVLRDQINGTVQPSLNIRTNDEIMSSWNASGQNLAAFSNTLQQRATEAGNTVLANGGTAEESDAARIKSLREGLVELGMLPTLDSDTFGKPSYQILLEAEMTTIRGQINGGTTTEKTGNDETTIANSRDFNSNSGITLQSIANTLTSGPTRIRPEEPSLISKPKDIYNDKIKESYLSSKAYQAAQAVIRNSNQTFSKQINT